MLRGRLPRLPLRLDMPTFCIQLMYSQHSCQTQRTLGSWPSCPAIEMAQATAGHPQEPDAQSPFERLYSRKKSRCSRFFGREVRQQTHLHPSSRAQAWISLACGTYRFGELCPCPRPSHLSCPSSCRSLCACRSLALGLFGLCFWFLLGPPRLCGRTWDEGGQNLGPSGMAARM